jgi:phage gp29-like protein
VTALLLELEGGETMRLDPRDFILFAHLGRYESPYGQSELRAAYRAYWLIDNIWKFRAVYLEKFGGPTLVAKHPAGALESERARLLEVLRTIQNETGIVIPDDVTIEAIDISTRGEADYRSAIHDLRREILVSVLGSFMTTEEGDRTGARALGLVHQDTVQVFVRFLAKLLANTINEQLVRPLVELNFARAQAPRFAFDVETSERRNVKT